MFFKYNIAALIWAIIIFIFCIIPGKDLPDLSFWDADKAAHALVFAILVFLLGRGFSRQFTFNRLRYRPLLFVVSISIVYGGLLEIMQSTLLTDRFGDMFDFIANCIGCFAGAWVFHKFHKRLFLPRKGTK